MENTIGLLADDTTLFLVVEQPERAASVINKDLSTVQTWAD